MYKVFVLIGTNEYHCVSQYNAEIITYECNSNYNEVYSGTRKQCNAYLEEITDVEIIVT
jgi:hypothetical protein